MLLPLVKHSCAFIFVAIIIVQVAVPSINAETDAKHINKKTLETDADSESLKSANITILKSSNDGPHPSSLHMAVQFHGGKQKAFLKLSKLNSKVNYPITISQRGQETTFPQHLLQNSSGHYCDDASGALISSRRVNGRIHFAGHFSHLGKAYLLAEPKDARSEHTVESGPAPLSKGLKEVRSDFIKTLRHRRAKRQTITTPTTNTIEIYLLVDNTVWEFVKSQSSSDTEALNFFHFYYKHIINGVDRTYRNIKEISISVECIGIYIAKTEEDAPWMAETANYAGTIMNKLEPFYKSKGLVADHFVFVTRGTLKTWSGLILGSSTLRQACQKDRISIIRDYALHSWVTIAHEIGHNLGAYHDGSGNSCDPSEMNVMKPSNSQPNKSNIRNTYRFSSCSVNKFRKYIDYMNSRGKNCLTKNDGERKAELSGPGKAGRRWTLDQVCKFARPGSLGARICPDDLNDPTMICVKITCDLKTNPGMGLRSYSGIEDEIRAPVGTPCGSEKSCDWNGQCVYDSSAPTADANCIFGDRLTSTTCAGHAEKARQDSSFREKFCAKLIEYCCKSIKTYCDDYKTK